METRTGILACEDALGKIRARLGGTRSGKGSKLGVQLGYLKERLVGPFKQSELVNCKEVLRSVQEDLHTALMILEMYVRTKEWTCGLFT